MTDTTYAPFKQVYTFDANNGEYLGPYNAQLDPVANDGTYITPLHCTDAAPAARMDYKVQVFASGAWAQLDDYRGQDLYNQADGSMTLVTAIGPIPSGYALTPPPPTVQEQVAQLEIDVQLYIDSKARAKGYDNANSCISYLNSGNATWKADAAAMNTWRDAVWTFCYNSAGSISVGTVPVPTKDQLLAALPAAPW